MVLTYRTGAAGSGGKGMADYLGAQADVPELAERLSAYLSSSVAAAEPGMTAAIPRRDMHPLIADLLNIDPNRSLSLEEMANLLAGHRTDGKAIPGKEIQRSTKDKARLAYTDFTFSAPKSFSVALVFAPTEAERAILEECWVRANDALVDHIANKIGGARQGKSGRNGVVPGHMAVVRYDHYTSRPTVKIATAENDTELITVPTHMPGDMQRHSHNIFLHVTMTEDGQIKSPNLDEIRENLHEWGAVGHAYLATFLREQGISVDIDPKTSLSRLTDVPRWACELFQNRADDGEEHARRYAASQGLAWDSLDPRARSAMLKNRVAATRRAKDGAADYQAWLDRAAKAGYRHRSVLRPDQRRGLADRGEQIKTAYGAALPLLEDQYVRRSKLDGSVVRTMAARGLIASGIASPRDVDLVTAAFRTEGIRQDGKMTAVVWGKEHDKRYASVTTGLHEDLEREAIERLRSAAADKSAALSKDQIGAALERVSHVRGYDFSTDHGRKQAAMAEAFAAGGRAIVGIGVAGAGKTAALEPVIDAYHAAGWQSYGVTLAWRQTHSLKGAGVGKKKRAFTMMPDTDRLTDVGIGEDKAFALTVFLKQAGAGELVLNDKTLIVIDEIATLGTRQILELGRLQAEHGFKLVGMGDDKQCQAIEAGHAIKLFRRALGKDQVPEILETIRQKRIEDRETARLFRDGDAGKALERKEAAGLLHLTPGGYADAIKAGVDEWERRTVANQNRAGYRIGISVPTNADAHAVGLEIRQRQRAAGRLTGNDFRIQAQDPRGVAYPMDVAVGDTVRLFNRVNARYGEKSRGYFGENGTTAEIVLIDAMEGLRLKRADGKAGFVKWSSLQDKGTGHLRLAYGNALTVDARQGDTLTDHITILPAGTRALNAFKIYPADTRNREDSVLIVSHGAEKEEVRNHRPMGDPWLASASDAEMRQAIRENMARNLSRQPEKGLAVDFINAGMDVFRGSVNGMQAAWHRSTEAAAAEREPDLANKFQERRQEAAVVSLLSQIKRSRIAIGGAVKLLTHEENKPKRRDNRTTRQEEAGLQRNKVKRRERQERTVDMTVARTEFADALRHAGLSLKGEPIMDGKWHRARAECDKGAKQSARYRGYLDHRPSGFIENFKTGLAQPWTASGKMPTLTGADKRRVAAARESREAERKTAGEKAGKKAWAIWMHGTNVTRHDYLARKGVRAHGLRQDRNGNLLIPVRDTTGFVRNVQTISPKGEKLFVKGGRKHGLFAQIGEIDADKPIMIAEGYATAATLYETTGLPVIIAFDSGNLLPVIEAIRAKYPSAPVVVAADNDHHLPRREKPLPNVGKAKADAAAKAVDGVVIAPDFGPIEKRVLIEGATPRTDFNDWAALNGKPALREIVEVQLKQQGIEMPDRKTERTDRVLTQTERDAARQRQQPTPSISQNQANENAQRQTKRQAESNRHNRRPAL